MAVDFHHSGFSFRVAERTLEPEPVYLTAAERRVAGLVAQGASTDEVAAILEISPRTVASHLGAVFLKLQVRDRLQLAALPIAWRTAWQPGAD